MAEPARIVGVGIVGNEADIVEAFVLHHARLLDGLDNLLRRLDAALPPARAAAPS